MSDLLQRIGGNVNAWLQERRIDEEEKTAQLVDDIMDGGLSRVEAERIVFDEY